MEESRYNERRINESLKEVSVILELSDDELLNLIPRTSGLYFVNCANCHVGAQERSPFVWDIKNPDKLVCEACGEEYPSTSYPENGFIKVYDNKGEPIFYKYYEDKNGHRHYFEAYRWDLQRIYMTEAALKLAELYDLTGDEGFARKSALILYGFAQVFPGWALHFDLPYIPKEFWSYNKGPSDVSGRLSWRVGKWTWWDYLGIDLKLIKAYDLIKSSMAFHVLSREMNLDVGKLIREDLFEEMVNHTMRNKESFTNMSPIFWTSVLRVAKAIQKPGYVEEVERRFKSFINTKFQYDGFWMENTPSYHLQTTDALRNFAVELKDIFLTLNMIPSSKDDIHSLELLDFADESIKKLRLPNGRFAPVNDTWHHTKGESINTSSPQLLPSMGYAILGSGTDASQIQAHLSFTWGWSHSHRDQLNLLLFAFGKEMLSDIGYTHTKDRVWTFSTAAHNTVVIDGKEQSIDPKCKGISLKAFGGNHDDFQVVSACSKSAYPNSSEYRRHLILVGTETGEPYILDIFNVAGGKVEDYIFHGDADFDSYIVHDLGAPIWTRKNLLPSNYQFVRPTGEHDLGLLDKGLCYGFIEDVKAFKVPGTFHVDFRYEKNVAPSLRVHFPSPNSDGVIIGKDFSIRRAKENDMYLDNYYRPVVLLRKEKRGIKQLRTLFSSILEPYQGVPFIHGIEVLKKDLNFIALQIDRGNQKDLLIVDTALTSQPSLHEFILPGGKGVRFKGKYGLARLRDDGKVMKIHGFGVREFTIGEDSLQSKGVLRGKILSAFPRIHGKERGSFIVDGVVKREVAGQTLILEYDDKTTSGFTIEAVEESSNDKSILYVREDPALIEEEGKIIRTACPQRHFSSWPKYYILLYCSK